MFKLMLPTAVAGVLLIFNPAAAQAALGPDAASCRAGSGQPAILVNVSGFKARAGRVRVQIYNASNYLVKGQRVRRVDLPVTSPTMPICVAVPRAGTYAVAVRHDADGDNDKGDWSDGGGFSRNPKISLFRLKPSFESVSIPVGNGVRPVPVVLNYRQGLSIRPIAG